jgi:N-acetylmuramoyl-L-alanine amidase
MSGPPGLPPIPFVAGSLAIRVVYPPPGHLIASSDSSFLLGSVGNGNATLTINGAPARVYPNGAFMAYVANPSAAAPQYNLVAGLGLDTVRATQAVRVASATPATPPPAIPPDTVGRWVQLQDPAASALPDTDQTVVGRPTPGDTYHWFFLPGTIVWRDLSQNGFSHLQLDHGLGVWVPDSLARPITRSAAPPARITGDADVLSSDGWEDFAIPILNKPAYFVEERDHALDLTLYDTRGNTDLIRYPTTDSLIRRVEWAQVRDDRVRYTLHLSQPVVGYLVMWRPGRLVLRVRRAPVVDAAHPLRGRTIAVDAGHPPAGATGPTGLYEATAVLEVAWRLRELLVDQGANVIMTRVDSGPVALDDRAVIARRANADAFVSIHLNAFPDGVNPFTSTEGSATYFYYGQAEPLARAVQRGLVARMGLPDQGIVFRSLAVVRQSWTPAILCEGAFVIIPEQEAALRTPIFQESYAQGIADGLAAYFRALASARSP